jgi:chromosome segregation ATPase
LREEVKRKDREIAKLNTEIDNLQEQQLRNISSPKVEEWARQCQNLRKLCKQLMSDKKDLQKQLNKAHSNIERLEEQLERLGKKLRQKQRDGDEHADELREKLDRTERELDQTKIERDEHADRAESLRMLVAESWDTIEQKKEGQAYPPTSPSLTVQGTSQRHRRSSSGSKQSHSNKHKALRSRVTEDIFGRGAKKETIYSH